MGGVRGAGFILVGDYPHGEAAGTGTQAVRTVWGFQWRRDPSKQEEQGCRFKSTDVKRYVIKSLNRELEGNGGNQVNLRDIFLSRVRKEAG